MGQRVGGPERGARPGGSFQSPPQLLTSHSPAKQGMSKLFQIFEPTEARTMLWRLPVIAVPGTLENLSGWDSWQAAKCL